MEVIPGKKIIEVLQTTAMFRKFHIFGKCYGLKFKAPVVVFGTGSK
jgi:hypothetical protein